MQKVNISYEIMKWPLTYIVYTRQIPYKLDEGILFNFVSEKNRPL